MWISTHEIKKHPAAADRLSLRPEARQKLGIPAAGAMGRTKESKGLWGDLKSLPPFSCACVEVVYSRAAGWWNNPKLNFIRGGLSISVFNYGSADR